MLADLESAGCVPLQYTDNFNGSCRAIAGVCDSSGRIFGLMPHPERFVERYQHPQWRATNIEPIGRLFFADAVQFAAQL
jgi:phosphoribosylformylglycinamidine synthase